MNRPAPKFAIGDEVIVIAEDGSIYREGVIGDISWIDEGDFEEGPYSGWAYCIWGRGALEPYIRKKPRPNHLPADQSFDELMRDLSRPREVVA